MDPAMLTQRKLTMREWRAMQRRCSWLAAEGTRTTVVTLVHSTKGQHEGR